MEMELNPHPFAKLSHSGLIVTSEHKGHEWTGIFFQIENVISHMTSAFMSKSIDYRLNTRYIALQFIHDVIVTLSLHSQ